MLIMRTANNSKKNSKSEILNPKQIINPKYQSFKQLNYY